jgi:uncharacterized protein (TIGR02284 family)
MKNEKSIAVLNTLITINNDRIEGYETASKESKESDLKSLFSKFITTSHNCKEALVKEVNNLGGEVAEGTTIAGKFFRVWMDLKVALTGKDRKAILDSCEFGEDKAIETYHKALEDGSEFLSDQHKIMISSQKASLKADHQLIKSLRDALVDA